MQKHQQLLHSLMANPRYNKPNGKGIKQTKEVKKLMATMLLKDQIKLAKKKYGYPHHNWPTPEKVKLPEFTIAELKEHKQNGKKLKDLANEYGVKPSYLSNHLTKQGIYWREL